MGNIPLNWLKSIAVMLTLLSASFQILIPSVSYRPTLHSLRYLLSCKITPETTLNVSYYLYKTDNSYFKYICGLQIKYLRRLSVQGLIPVFSLNYQNVKPQCATGTFPTRAATISAYEKNTFNLYYYLVYFRCIGIIIPVTLCAHNYHKWKVTNNHLNHCGDYFVNVIFSHC
jgi:hypothetical protein